MEPIYVTVLLVIIGLFFVWWKKQHNSAIEWTIVRPDGLINNKEISTNEVYASPTRSAVFNAGNQPDKCCSFYDRANYK